MNRSVLQLCLNVDFATVIEKPDLKLAQASGNGLGSDVLYSPPIIPSRQVRICAQHLPG
jgi:hypothetical protein